MSSLIEELQRDALNQRIAVTELLQKSLVVATKLGVKELENWARLELDGYPGTDVPKYRDVHGEPEVYNPYRGYQPLLSEDAEFLERISLMHFNQSISDIEFHLEQCRKSKSSSIHCSYPSAFEQTLRNAIDFGLTPSLRINASHLQRILESVRRAVLEWSLRLEAAGVKGDGMSFSPDEKKKAQTVTYNIETYIHGNVSQSQVGTQDSVQYNFDLSKLNEFIGALKENLANLELDDDNKAELMAEVQTLESQAVSPRPKVGIIRESLATARNILEGIAGNLAAAAILTHLPKF